MQTQALIIPDRTLEPSWELKRAREPGFLRSLTTWVGGPRGYINSNIEHSAISAECAVGLMRMPTGNRQPGVHVHSVTEIYVILKGEVESFDGVGNVHRAGPLDCLYIPSGVPHGVRAIGPDDLELIWIHDAIEKVGVSIYLEGDGPFPADDEVVLVSHAEIARRQRGARGGQDSGSASWVSAPQDHARRSGSVPNDRVGVGLSVIPPGQSQAARPAADGLVTIVLDGHATVSIADEAQRLGPLDGLYLPAGAEATLSNQTDAALRVLWVREVCAEV